jgi:feruloyl esterase
MAIALREGYATASTDDGTAGDIPGFLTDFDKVADWRVYAVHETAQNAKAIVQTVYGRPAHHSYFTGCSKGGSEASTEIQRYPDEFDGVVGGAAAFNGVNNQVDTIWHIVQVNGSAANTTPVLAEGPLSILHNAVIKACGRQDGGIPSDIYLNDPQDCHFDPGVLQCKAGQDPSTCLTADQVKAARNLYAGPLNPSTGERFYPGVPRGQEAPPGTNAQTSGNLYGWQGWSPIPPPGFWVGGSLTAPTVGNLLVDQV